MNQIYALFKQTPYRKLVDTIDGTPLGTPAKELVSLFQSETGANAAKAEQEAISRKNHDEFGCDIEEFSVDLLPVNP